jgi:uncharacterized phage infection (PIP) family protein YhgE
MRITKEIASQVAAKLLSLKYKELAELRKDFSDTVREMYMQTVPDDVIKCFKKHPIYFGYSQGNSITLYGNGFNHEHIHVERIPSNGKMLTPSKEQADTLQKLQNKIKDLDKAAKELRKSIEVALYNLRTYEKVKTVFPEAYEFLPEANTAIAINVDSIRELLIK